MPLPLQTPSTPERKDSSNNSRGEIQSPPASFIPGYSPNNSYSLCANGWNSTPMPSTSYRELEEQLEIERTETDRAQRQVAELRGKCEKLQDAQVNSEATIASQQARIEELERLYKRAGDQRRHAEESLLVEQQLYITEKHQLFLKQSELEESVSQLSKRIKEKEAQVEELQEREATLTNDLQTSAVQKIQQESESVVQAAQVRESTLQKNIERLKQTITVLETSSEQIGLDFASKATAFDEELRSLKEINNSLVDENEKLQMLVAEKMINGDMNLGNELALALEEESEEEEEEEENEEKEEEESKEENATGTGYTESTVSVTEYEKVNKELKKMRLEYRSLFATNEGLVSYVERMLNRLLEYEDFRDGVQKATKIDAAKVGAFSRRVSSRGGLEDHALRVAKRGERNGAGDNSSIHSRESIASYNPLSTSLWASALFSKKKAASIGGASLRNVSLGIDGVETNSTANSTAPSASTNEDCMSLKSEASASTEDGDVCSPIQSRKSSSQSQTGLKPLSLRKNSWDMEAKKGSGSVGLFGW